MNMTHYMELLAVNQPWNLLIFMAIPIVLAETLAITELYLLSTRNYSGWVHSLNTVIDVVAVGSYLIGGLPLIYIAFQELGWVNAKVTDESKRQTHAICVALFLVFGHIAMIAGMLDPALLGYVPEGMSEMHNH